MPTHEFACKCGSRKEIESEFGKKPKSVVCICGEKMQPVLYFPPVHFRGPGWSTSGDYHDIAGEEEFPQPKQTDSDEKWAEWRDAKDKRTKQKNPLRMMERVVPSGHEPHTSTVQNTGGRQEKEASQASREKEEA